MNSIFDNGLGLLLASVGDDGPITADDQGTFYFFAKVVIVGALYLAVWLIVFGGLAFVANFLWTLPVRRATRARLFLDLIESALKQGRPLEETLISLSHLGDRSLSVSFHLFAAWLERGLSFPEALAKVPALLSPQVTAMLRAGQKIGDLRKVLPACRQLLGDSISRTRNAVNYFFILTFVVTPLGVLVFHLMHLSVFPKYEEMSAGVLGGDATEVRHVMDHATALTIIQATLLLLLWLAAILHLSGPQLAVKFPILDWIYLRLPWHRKRLQRDFSTLLAVLLDAGMPEPEAVILAADCTANTVFRRRARAAVNQMAQGMTLTQAVQSMDDSGEFAWRMANAFHGRIGFRQALAGWHEALDAKAFQEEQAASQGITTGLVLWTGLFVGAVTISAFGFLTSLVDSAVLW